MSAIPAVFIVVAVVFARYYPLHGNRLGQIKEKVMKMEM